MSQPTEQEVCARAAADLAARERLDLTPLRRSLASALADVTAAVRAPRTANRKLRRRADALARRA